MSKPRTIAYQVVACALILLVAGCTRAKPPLPTMTPVSATGGSELTGTPSGTVVSSGPTATQVPTSTPTPCPSATPTLASTTPLPTPTPTDCVPPPPYTQYTVQWGDTVFSLARRFGTTVCAIVQLNHLANPGLINVGQELQIPGEPKETKLYTVQPGDTLYSIAKQFGIAWQTLASVNHILNPSELQVGQQLIIPEGPEIPEGAKTYIVKPGDTLYRIALTNGTTVQALVMANNLPGTYIIHPGQVLIIP